MAAAQHVERRDAEHEGGAADIACPTVCTNFACAVGLSNTATKSFTSMRMVSGLNTAPTGCCIQPLAIRVPERREIGAERHQPSHGKTGRKRVIEIGGVVCDFVGQIDQLGFQ